MEPINVVAAVDIGTSRISVAIKSFKESSSQLVMTDFANGKSNGVRRGVIVNEELVRADLQNLLSALERKNNARIVSMFVGINGINVRSQSYIAQMSITKSVTMIDVRNLEKSCDQASIGHDEMILMKLPQSYRCDNQSFVQDPVGRQCSSLECQYTLLIASREEVSAIDRCVRNAGCDCDDVTVVPTVYAAACGALSDTERRNGVALVDFGAATPGTAVFVKGCLRQISVLPFGAHTVTTDIARCCEININQSEKIKKGYGRALGDSSNSSQEYSIYTSSGGTVKLLQKQLDFIIQARMEEILDHVESEIANADGGNGIMSGIVAVGGGAELAGIRELVQQRMGKSLTVRNHPGQMSASLPGLLDMAVTRRRQKMGPQQGELFGAQEEEREVREEKPEQPQSGNKFYEIRKYFGGLFTEKDAELK